MSIRSLAKPVAKAFLFGGRGRWCPVCERHARKFRSFGLVDGEKKRVDAMCPWCGTLERHRLVMVFFAQKTNLFDGKPKSLLHVAPEERIESIFRRVAGNDYLSGDLFDEKAMEKMDITDIQHPDDSFDVIYCSHVLEHVPDDRLAMRELRRVLKPGGWAVLNVPVTTDKTFEDPSIKDPAERERVFGQHDHVRRYGRDYQDRLVESGFHVQPYQITDLYPENEHPRLRLAGYQGTVYRCTK